MKFLQQQILPRLPQLAALALARTPNAVVAPLLERALGHFFKEELAAGALDFLADRSLHIHVSDLQLQFCVSLRQGHLQVTLPAAAGDASIRASSNDFILMINGRVDPDTLFFQRRLLMSGDTEMALQVKNLLDTIELAERLRQALLRASALLADQLQQLAA